MIDNKFQNSKGDVVKVEQVFNEFNLDIVIFIDDKQLLPTASNTRRFCLDLYTFLSEFELMLDEDGE